MRNVLFSIYFYIFVESFPHVFDVKCNDAFRMINHKLMKMKRFR